MSKKSKCKIEFSKIIFIGISVVTISVAVFACVMIWKTSDLSPFAYLIPSVFTELATATGFYYSKAKTENQIKLKKLYGDKYIPAEDNQGQNIQM
ncbi:hypothetical protein [Tepidibacillus marianensis]|uniref:hypothetical protein n=1 Tax=Tepidibacillus marianensis TaxID=3131995 RepID=UPI0030D318A8